MFSSPRILRRETNAACIRLGGPHLSITCRHAVSDLDLALVSFDVDVGRARHEPPERRSVTHWTTAVSPAIFVRS